VINPNWIRWVRASARVYFDARKTPYTLFIEGDDRDNLRNLQAWAEFRINGPSVTPKPGGTYQLDSIINVFLMVKQDPLDLDVAAKIAGHFQSIFGDFSVYKYGSGPDDSPDQNNPEFVGCMVLQGEIIYTNFSVVDNDLKLEEGAVAARFSMEI
jgi:hypothetical protein